MREETLRTMIKNRNLRILTVFCTISRKTSEIFVKTTAEISEGIYKEIISKIISVGFFKKF